MSASIQVAIKVRPLIKREKDENLPIQWTVQDKCIAPLDPELKKRGEGGFYFDHIFDINTTNVDVFNTIAKAIIEAAVNGFNGTIFAYGQTSSGKTYTMMGSSTEPGVIPLSVRHIFDLIHKSDRQFLLRVSYIEIYNERVNDLLNPEETDLKIKDNPKTGQAYVQCKEELVNCPENVLAIMKKGDKNRRIGETNMNERSSRSHTILRITIESRDANADEQGAIQVSQLNLVDLAGSERAGQTGAIGTRFKEGTHINMSLSALGLVIMQLSEAQDNPKAFVNFRDSKLTRILQCSLGGNAMTTIICAVTPAAIEETQCTLAFASRAKRIKNKPKLNEELSEATLLKRYAKHITKLETELKKVKSTDVVEMESKLLEKERANQILEERIELLKKSILCGNSSSEKEEGVFQAEKQRRRTWSGSGTLATKIPTFQNVIGLPTIIEMEKTPEKKKETFKEHSKRRQSIIQQIDIANESFQTAFTDFELELIERERARESRLSDGSSSGDDYWMLSKRSQRSVKFMDDVAVLDTSRQSFDATVEPKSPEQCKNEPPSPGTPKVALRKRISFLVETYNSLCEQNGELTEFTKLERQMIVDEEVERAMAVHNEKLAEREQMLNELNDKYIELQLQSTETDKRLSESDRRLAECEQQLAQSVISLRVLRDEKQALVNELEKLKAEDAKSNEFSPTNKDEEKETSSIFENASYFEEMNVSDVPTDSVFANETQQAMQELTMCDGDSANTTITSDVRELKLLTEQLNQTVKLLTIENADLMTKLATQKEEANRNEKNLQDTISELLTKIHTITEEKNLLKNNIREREQRLEKSDDAAQSCVNDNETASLIENLRTTIASLTAENIELSTNLMNKIEEFDKAKDVQSPSGDHNCAYRELSVNLSERNKLLESENIELSTNLMDKIEEYDQVKEKLEALQWKLSSSPSRVTSNNLMEISMNLLEKEKTVDDLLRLSIGVNNSKRASFEKQSSNGDVANDFLLFSTVGNGSICHENGSARVATENGEKLDVSEISRPTVDEMLEMSILPNGKSRHSIAIDNLCLDNSEGSWKIKAEILEEEVKNLQLQNEKYKDSKRSACKQCAHRRDLSEDRRVLKVEMKEISRKLQLLQNKFERECADSEILRTKANEDLNISVADSTMNESAFEGSFSVSVLEDRVLRLRNELDSLRDKHGKLLSDYDEKCDEIEKLQDASSRETSPTPSSTDSPRPKRSNAKLEELQTDRDNIKTDLRRLKKEITGIRVAQQKFGNEKSSMKSEVETLRAEKSELEEKLATIQESIIAREKIIETLEQEVQRFNAVKNDLENAKAALEDEVQDLKTGKASLEEEFAAIRDSGVSRDKIEALEKEVERLRKEIECSNVVKNDLEKAKVALEAEVEALKRTEEASLEVEKSSETVDSSVPEEKMRSLENEVARLGEEIENSNVVKLQLENAKSTLEAEVETFKAANLLMEKKIAALENSSPSEEKIGQLESEVARLNEQIAFSENARRDVESAKSSLEAEVESLKTANTSLEGRFADVENLSVERERIAMLEKDLARLADEIETSNTIKEELQSAKSTLEAEVESLITKNATLEEKFAAIEEDPSISEEKIKQLENELARLNEEIYKSNAVNQQLEDAKSSLETEVQSLITAKESLENKFASIENSSLAGEKIEHLESEVSRLNEEICASTSAKQELEAAKLHLEAEVQSLKSANSSQEENHLPELKDSSIAEEKIKQLELEVARLSEEIRSASLANQDLQSAKSSLEAEVEFLTSQKTVIEEGSTELMRALRNIEENNSSLKLELEKITSEKNEILNNRLISSSLEIIDSPNNNVEDYEKNVEIESLKSKLKEATEEKNVERNERLAEIAAAEAELDAAKSRLSQVTTSLDEFVAENATLKEKLTELIKTSEEELTNTKLHLNNEVTILRAEIAKLEENFDSLNRELRELEDKNAALTNELESVRAKEEDKSVGEISQDSPYETLKEYEAKVEELQTKLQDITKDLHSSIKESSELNEQLTKLSAAKEEFNDIRLSLEREVTNLKNERADLEETLTSLRESLGNLEEKNAFLNAELEAIKTEKERIEAAQANSSHETVDETELFEREKTIESLNARVRIITVELENYASENDNLKSKVSELEAALSSNKSALQNFAGSNSREIDGNLRDEVDSARVCIMKEIKSLKATSESQDLSEKSVSDLFGVFVREIMSKEEEIIKMLNLNFEREKRKLEESKRQSVDAEKRANVWAKELEAEIEKTQQDLSAQESKNAALTAEIAKLNNLLMESAHENQMLNEKMKVLELDFNTLQADLESRSGSKHNSTLNTTQQERERLIEEALASREMELSSKLRLAEKNYKEKLEELTNNLESQKMKNMELTSNLEGLEMNEKQLRNIVDMKSTELAKCSNTVERLQSELNDLTEKHNRLGREHEEKSQQVEEITSLLKNKCDKLSEYKTKLETISPEYEHLKEQAAERQVRLEKYKSELECITSANEKQIASLKDKLDSEEIKSAGYKQQLAELTNRNTALQTELEELRTKCDELERSNAKLTKSLRNSTSRIRAEEEMEDLRDNNRTLQRNLDGAANRISELQEMRTQMMKELVELRGSYEVVCNENAEMRNSLATHRSGANDAFELRGKYELLLQEKNRVTLELEDKKSNLVQLEKKFEACVKECEELKKVNKDLDEEMEDMVEKINELTKENAELDDKLYAMTSTQTNVADHQQVDLLLAETQQLRSQVEKHESEIAGLRLHRDRLRGELEAATKSVENLNSENYELRGKVARLDRADSLSCDSSRSASPAPDLEPARVDRRRRRSRTELFNQKRQLELVDNDGKFPWGEGCRCVALEKKVRELEHDLVSKNGEVAALEIRIQSENFPYVKRAKDLEELLGSSRRKIKTLEAELLRLRELKNMEISSECRRCKQWNANKRDQSSQCMPETSKIRLNGMSSGILEEHIKIAKLEKTNETLKALCRTRQRNVLDLEKQVKELEKKLNMESAFENDTSELATTSARSTSSKPDFTRAMKENVPKAYEVLRPSTHVRRDWFN